MSKVEDARDAVDAVRKFARSSGRAGGPPGRIQARLGGASGMATLCAVEGAICELWPPSTAKELIWLSRTAAGEGNRLQLQAYSPAGESVFGATYRLAEINT